MNKAEKKLLFDEFRSWLTETQGLEFNDLCEWGPLRLA